MKVGFAHRRRLLLRPASHPRIPEEFYTPALVALVDVLPAVPAHPGVGRDGSTAPGALEGLCRCLVVLIEVCKLNHQVGSHDGQW